MPYQQYTHCIPRSEFGGGETDVGAAAQGLAGGFVGGFIVGAIVATGITALTGGGAVVFFGIALAFAAAGAIYGAFEGFCGWWLNCRLVCIHSDQCVIGQVMAIDTPSSKRGGSWYDNDYDIDLLLAPHRIGDTCVDIQGDGLQGMFLEEQPETMGLPHTECWNSKYFVSDPGGTDGGAQDHCPTGPSGSTILCTPLLHCEFEGSRVSDICSAGKFTAIVIGAVIAICIISGGTACLVAAIVAIILLILVWLAALFASHDGSPADAATDTASGTLHAADNHGQPGDCVVITGDWVYDSGHQGWNEIHPVKSVQIHPGYCPGDEDVAAFKANIYDVWCNLIHQAQAPQTIQEQDKPANQWVVHPLLG